MGMRLQAGLQSQDMTSQCLAINTVQRNEKHCPSCFKLVSCLYLGKVALALTLFIANSLLQTHQHKLGACSSIQRTPIASKEACNISFRAYNSGVSTGWARDYSAAPGCNRSLHYVMNITT